MERLEDAVGMSEQVDVVAAGAAPAVDAVRPGTTCSSRRRPGTDRSMPSDGHPDVVAALEVAESLPAVSPPDLTADRPPVAAQARRSGPLCAGCSDDDRGRPPAVRGRADDAGLGREDLAGSRPRTAARVVAASVARRWPVGSMAGGIARRRRPKRYRSRGSARAGAKASAKRVTERVGGHDAERPPADPSLTVTRSSHPGRA